MIHYKKKLRFLVRKLEKQYFLVSKGTCFTLNEIAYEILNFIKVKKTLGEISNMLVNNYEVDRKLAENDIKETLDYLIKAGAVEMLKEEKNFPTNSGLLDS